MGSFSNSVAFQPWLRFYKLCLFGRPVRHAIQLLSCVRAAHCKIQHSAMTGIGFASFFQLGFGSLRFVIFGFGSGTPCKQQGKYRRTVEI
jgi:hypothetical protein